MTSGFQRCRSTFFIFPALAAFVVLSAPCRADVAELLSGERLIGSVKTMAGGKLVFTSKSVGDVTLPMAQLRSLVTDAPLTLLLAGGAKVQTRLLAGHEGKFAMESGGPELPLTSLIAINPPPPPNFPFHGSAALGLSILRNTVNSDNFSLSGSMVRARPTDKTTADASYVNSRQSGVTTSDASQINSEYDFGVQRRFYGFVNGGLRKDRIQKLDLRTLAGGGTGYHIEQTPQVDFSATAGLSYLNQDFSGQKDQSKLTTQFGYELNKRRFIGFHLRHTLDYYPEISNFGSGYLQGQFILQRDLKGSLSMDIRYIADYTSSPAAGAKHSTSQFIVGIGKSF